MEIELCRLTGKNATIAICILLLLLGLRFWYLHNTENDALTKEAIVKTIDPFVKAHYSRQAYSSLKSAIDSNDHEKIERITREITRIDYKSITVKGLWSPLVVRAEVMTDGKTPSV